MTASQNSFVPTHPNQFWLRGETPDAPIGYNEHRKMWNVYGHPEALRVIGDTATFSSDTTALMPEMTDEFSNDGNLVQMDPPDHTKLRRLVTHAFTPKIVAGLEPRIAQVTHELLDALDGRDRIELVEDLAYPLPVIVIAELLGVPASDRDQFRQWARALVEDPVEFSLDLDEQQLESLQTQLEGVRAMTAYILDHAADRRKSPREDLITLLVQAQVEGERLSDNEIANFASLLLLAGHITTTLLLGNTTLCLDAHRDQQARVRTDRTLLPSAIEESLRFFPPFASIVRVTKNAKEIGDVTIPANAPVSVWLGAANRDPRVFADVHTFDVSRNPNPHIAFGRGIHFCVGAPLARMEGRVALDILLDRYPEFSIDPNDPPTFVPSPDTCGVRTLPLRLG